jgi:hypothetical protein
MKLSMHWAAVAAMLAVTASHAATVTLSAGSDVVVFDPADSGRAQQLTFGGGAATLEFSNGTGVAGGIPVAALGGVISPLDYGQVQLSPLGAAKIKETMVDIDGELYRGNVAIDTKVTSLVVDSGTGRILLENTAGGVDFLAPKGLAGALMGGDFKMSNIRLDLDNRTVIADVEGTPLVRSGGSWAPGVTTTQSDLALWTSGFISGPSTIRSEGLMAAADGDFSQMEKAGYQMTKIASPDGTGASIFLATATTVFGKLQATPAGLDFFTNSLGYRTGSELTRHLREMNDGVDGWGSITSTISFTQATFTPGPTIPVIVPEPSTYALMGLGLFGIGLVARRQRS